MQNLSTRGVGLRVLTGQGAQIDTTPSAGCLVFGIFEALAEFERERVRSRILSEGIHPLPVRSVVPCPLARVLA